MEEHEDIGMTEGSEYSPKSEFSKPKLVYDAIQRCIEARGKEMKAGYENTKLTRDGLPIITWIPDARQIFIGCVIAVKDILDPEILSNNEYKKLIEECDKKIQESEKLYSYKELERKQDKNTGRRLWVETEKKFLNKNLVLVVLFFLLYFNRLKLQGV